MSLIAITTPLNNPSNAFPSLSNAILFAGVARVFTAINPIAAAITGAIAPIAGYAIYNILPDNLSNDQFINNTSKYVIASLMGLALGGLAANVLSFSISLKGIFLLSASSNILLLGIAYATVAIAKRILATQEERISFIQNNLHILDTSGHPLIAAMAAGAAAASESSDLMECIPDALARGTWYAVITITVRI